MVYGLSILGRPDHRGITQDEYDKKATELNQRQQYINIQLQSHTDADEKFGNTLISILDIASRAYELFESSKVEQKRQLINFTLSNIELKGGTLEFTLKKPFDMLLNLESRSCWLGIVDTFRTNHKYYSSIIAFSEQIEIFNETFRLVA